MDLSLWDFLESCCQQTAVSAYIGLFTVSFLAATLLPMGSEPYLIILARQHDHGALWFVATAGNSLGSLVTYYMGGLGKTKWMGLSQKKKEKYSSVIEEYGPWAGLFAWIPFVGDVFALLMGLLKTPPVLSFIAFAIGKGIRYAIVIGFL